ncbi:MAG: hypothetical protein HYX61_10965 [Gammaproteobacteria bacterium]|jgi:hypothetical protein|nr:hypothetical protein [Gammaproteobacteria bacterium]
MKHAPTPSYPTRSILLNLGTESLEHAVSIMTNESQFEHLGFDNILSICASHEEIAFDFLNDEKNWPYLDGLSLSMLGEKKVRIAKFILKIPELREKLFAVDIVRLGQLPEIADIIISDRELHSKLNSMQLASLGEHHFAIASKIYHSPLFSRIDISDLWRLCRNHKEIAEKIIADETILENIEGSDLAKIVELHEDLIWRVLKNPKCMQLDPNSLVILGRQFESVARYLINDQKYRDRLGPFGIARVAQNHEALAHELVESLTGNSLAQLAEVHESVAKRIYTTSDLRKKLNLDELVLLGKHHLFIAQALLEDPLTRQSLSGQQLVILGQAHVPVAHDILQDPLLKQKALGKNIGLLGLKDEDVANLMMNDLSLRECVQQLDLANLCKNFSFVTQLVIHDEALYKKVSVSYQNLLRERQNVVIALSTFVQRAFSKSILTNPSEYSFPLQNLTKPLPVPSVDMNFIQKFQSMRL